MEKRGIVLALLSGVALLTSPAFGQDVLMRRPLPAGKTTQGCTDPTQCVTPTPCDLTGTCTPVTKPPQCTVSAGVTQCCSTDATGSQSCCIPQAGQTTCDPVTTPTPTPQPTPTPTNCDTDGNCPSPTPTPTPTEGCDFNPTYLVPQQDPGYSNGIYQWITDGWTTGGQCGVDGTMTRQAACVMLSPDWGWGGGVIGSADPAPDAPRTLQASYAGTGHWSDGVYHPGENDASFQTAQFGSPFGPGVSVIATPVPAEYCVQNVGNVCNSYHGTKANCGYTTTDDPGGTSDWTIDPWEPGTATCSGYAQRTVSHMCLDGGGNRVDDGFCSDELYDGGVYNGDFYESTQYGNFTGCTARWVGVGEDLGCSLDGSFQPGTDTHYAYYHYECVRSDGTVLTGVDEASCTDQKPFDGTRSIGSCSKTFGNGWGGVCLSNGNGSGYNYGYDTLPRLGMNQRTNTTPGYMYGQQGLQDCLDNGSQCCGSRYNDDDDGVLTGQVTTVGSTGHVTQIYGRYIDDGTPTVAYGSNEYLSDGTIVQDVCIQYMIDGLGCGLAVGTQVSYAPLACDNHMLLDDDGAPIVTACSPSSHYWYLDGAHAYWLASGSDWYYTPDSWDVPNDDPDPNAAPPQSNGGGPIG